MPASRTKLLKLPRSLRTGIDRRTPRGWIKDQTGKKFGAKTVIGFAGYKGHFASWLCRCKCGLLSVIRGAFLHKYHKNCHCRPLLTPAAKKLRGLHRAMIGRCCNSDHPDYRLYGAKGATVCKRWRDSLEAFAIDMGPRPSKNHVVARRNRRGNYTPANCFWATRSDVLRQCRRTLTYNGESLDLEGWARRLSITREAMRQRVKRCAQLQLDPTCAITADWRQGKAMSAV